MTPRGQCCPTCAGFVDASIGVCDQANFAAFLQKEIAGFNALACTTSSDCALIYLSTACGADCGTAMSSKFANTIYNDAQAFAQANCSGCPPTMGSGPCPMSVPECLGGICTSVIPL